MKKNRRRRRTEAAPINVTVPPIAIDTHSLYFPDGSRWMFNLTTARRLVRLDLRREIHRLDHDDLGRLIQDQVAGIIDDERIVTRTTNQSIGIVAPCCH